MTKQENVLNYYIQCNKLKDLIRTGWQRHNVKKERLESVAEHVYGTQMLAIAIYSEYEYNIDLKKVLLMLSIHEIGETIIGDYTPYDISREDKNKIEHEAIHKILRPLNQGKEIEKLIIEFDEHKTLESKFAFRCDKLECDIQCKLYDVNGYSGFNEKMDMTERQRQWFENGYSRSEIRLMSSQEMNNYDKNFKEISNYLLENKKPL